MRMLMRIHPLLRAPLGPLLMTNPDLLEEDSSSWSSSSINREAVVVVEVVVGLYPSSWQRWLPRATAAVVVKQQAPICHPLAHLEEA